MSINPKLLPQEYSWNGKKFHSIPAWVRKITVDLYGVDPTEEAFILPYELDDTVQNLLKELELSKDDYRDAIIQLQAQMLLKASKLELADKQDNKPDGTTLLIDPITGKISIIYMGVASDIFQVVTELPIPGEKNIIYLLPKVGDETDNFEEWAWINDKYEFLGTVSVDLSNYYDKDTIDLMFADYVAKEAGKGLSSNDYTNGDKQNVEKIPTIEQDIADLENDKVDKADIVDNLTTDNATKVLSAKQGKALKDLIDTTVGNIEDILDNILGV